MEQLVIFILFVVASIVSSIIQNKKKQAEERAERQERLDLPPPQPHRTSEPPVTTWPRSAGEWQEQLKKMLEGQLQPPIVRPPPRVETRTHPPVVSIPTTLVPPEPREISEGELQLKSPFRQSSAAHERALALHSRVEERFRKLNSKTSSHRPPAPQVPLAPITKLARQLRRNPMAAREAFIASLVFGPPKSLSHDD